MIQLLITITITDKLQLSEYVLLYHAGSVSIYYDDLPHVFVMSCHTIHCV